MHDAINIRSARFLLARTVGRCPHCHEPTSLVGLAVPPGHMVLELDADVEDEAAAVDAWRIESGAAFVFWIEVLGAAALRRIRQFTRGYRFADREGGPGAYWANHCEQCGGPIDDQDLHCEPDVAFLPTSEAQAGLIQLLSIDEAFEAAAGGYSHEPAFFHAMR